MSQWIQGPLSIRVLILFQVFALTVKGYIIACRWYQNELKKLGVLCMMSSISLNLGEALQLSAVDRCLYA